MAKNLYLAHCLPKRYSTLIFLNIVLIFLISVCIFDPASKLLKLKELLFILTWTFFILDIFLNNKIVNIPFKLAMYLITFIFLIPLTSAGYHAIAGSNIDYQDCYNYLKPYLFLTIVVILFVSKIDLEKPMIIILSILSIVTIIIWIMITIDSSLILFLRLIISDKFGILDVGTRIFGDFIVPQVHFHTSPLLIFPIGYFSFAIINSIEFKKKICSVFLLVISIVAMFLGGTRNNILASILTPIIIFCWYSKKKAITISITLAIIVIIIFSYIDTLQAMVNPEEPSNSIKLTFKKDYLNLFADWKILFFGQGLGSSFHTTVRGTISITELTYFEQVRRFGLLLSLASFFLLAYPLSKLRLKEYYKSHYLFICYGIYLVGSFFQPLLMSSSGMLLLSLVLCKTFIAKSSIPIEHPIKMYQLFYRESNKL